MADIRSAPGSIKVTVRGVKEIVGGFDALPETIRGALAHEVTDLTAELYARARRRAGGEILKVKSGRFLDSLKQRVRVSTTRVRGTVLSSGLGRRSGFLEFGGHARARLIPVKNAKALHFLRAGAEIFARVVHHPGPRIKQHPIIYGALEEMQGAIVQGLENAVSGAIETSK